MITKSEAESKELSDATAEALNSWTLDASKAGTYKITIENTGASNLSAILMANFNNCKQFKKLVKKTEMEEINSKAEAAIGTLYHNMVELEHSESRLNSRKESRRG